jgi:SLA1 homology domain 1, SHD1.
MVLPALLAVAAATAADAAEPELRTWTDINGRRIEASLKSREDTAVVLTLENGREVKVPLESLSADDREWLAQNVTDGGSPGYDGPPAEADWPRTVSQSEPPKARITREDRERREFVYETEHYEFICDSQLGINVVRDFSRVFEATWLANCLLPLELKPVPEPGREKFQARLFTDAGDYLKNGGLPGSAGIYSGEGKSMMLPIDSVGVRMFGSRVTVDPAANDYNTLIHEITHQMMNRWLGRIPIWFAEGSAEYVAIAKFDNGRFSFVQQDRQLKEYLSRHSSGVFSMVPLESLMTIDARTWSTSLENDGFWRYYLSALVLTYYFYHLDGDGKGTHIKAFMRAIENPDAGSGDGAVKEHLLRDRDYATLQSDVQKAMRRLGIALTFEE